MPHKFSKEVQDILSAVSGILAFLSVVAYIWFN